MGGNRHIAWRVVVVGCLALQGCYTYKSIPVKVVDAESGEPVPGATVWVGYENIGITYTPLSFLAPRKEHSAVTGPDGVASLPVHNGHPPWLIRATGYVDYHQHAEEGRVPDDFTRTTIEDRPVYVAPLYRAPRPVVWVVVADGYRGAIRMSRSPVQQSTNGIRGQRVFEFRADADGDVHIAAPPQLGRTVPQEIRFRYENGDEIPRQPLKVLARFPVAPRTQAQFGWDHIYGIGRERQLYVIGGAETALNVMEPFKTERGGYHLNRESFELAWNRRLRHAVAFVESEMKRHLIGWLACIACVSTQGCYVGKTLTVRVVDADTAEPVPDASVSVEYGPAPITYTPLFFLMPTGDDPVVTGADGVARIQVHNAEPWWHVLALGYVDYHGSVREGRVPPEFVKMRVRGRDVYLAPLTRASEEEVTPAD